MKKAYLLTSYKDELKKSLPFNLVSCRMTAMTNVHESSYCYYYYYYYYAEVKPYPRS